jgi:pre-rRNA-processing protein TSR1
MYSVSDFNPLSFSLFPAMDGDARIVAQPDAQLQESLQTKNIPDETANEQTWPTAEELEAAENARSQRKRRVPKGTSPYMAAWIPDVYSDVEDSDDSDDDEDGNSDDMDDAEEAEEEEDEESDVEMDAEQTQVRVDGGKKSKTGKSVRFQDDDSNDGGDLGDDEMEADAGAETKRSRRRQRTEDDEVEDDINYTDEVDVPEDQPARFRFHKYRGLRSFRTSPWDPKENLPFDYARIFQFENFKRTKKRVLAQHDGLSAGSWLCLNLRDVHVNLLASHVATHPLLLSGLFKFENKMSTINYTMTKVATYPKSLRSKEELWFHVGFRRFKASPIYSEHSHRSDKFKQMKFLHDNGVAVATILGPITFPPMPLLVWKELQPGRPVLCATGGVLSVNPDRIVLKKIVLTAKPFRVRNRRAVCRDMFYNPEDIKWFKPIELWTKRGLTGHISEPLGTHGYMKCTFSGKLDHGDTVCMSLYKRVFPTFAQMPTPVRPYPIIGDDVVAPEHL